MSALVRVIPTSFCNGDEPGTIVFSGGMCLALERYADPNSHEMVSVRPWFRLNGATIVGRIVTVTWGALGLCSWDAIAKVEIQ